MLLNALILVLIIISRGHKHVETPLCTTLETWLFLGMLFFSGLEALAMAISRHSTGETFLMVNLKFALPKFDFQNRSNLTK